MKTIHFFLATTLAGAIWTLNLVSAEVNSASPPAVLSGLRKLTSSSQLLVEGDIGGRVR